MLYLNLRICCGLGLITAWRPGTWVSSNWAPAKKSPGDVQKPRQRAWIPLMLANWGQIIGSPAMTETEDPHLLAWLCTRVRSQRKRARWENGASLMSQGRPSPYKQGRRAMPGDQCHARRGVGWPESPEKIETVCWKLLEQAGCPPAGTDDSRQTGDFPSSPRIQGGRMMGHNLNNNQVVHCQMTCL